MFMMVYCKVAVAFTLAGLTSILGKLFPDSITAEIVIVMMPNRDFRVFYFSETTFQITGFVRVLFDGVLEYVYQSC